MVSRLQILLIVSDEAPFLGNPQQAELEEGRKKSTDGTTSLTSLDLCGTFALRFYVAVRVDSCCCRLLVSLHSHRHHHLHHKFILHSTLVVDHKTFTANCPRPHIELKQRRKGRQGNERRKSCAISNSRHRKLVKRAEPNN